MFIMTNQETNPQPLWQSIIDKAYAKWQTNSNQTYEDFQESLDDISRSAVALKNLNYQVSNGGYCQWQVNGYDIDADVLEETLEKINTHASRAILETMNNFCLTFDSRKEVQDELKRAIRHCDLLEDYIDDFLQVLDDRYDSDIEVFDSKFFDNNEELMIDIENWLKAQL